MDKYQSAIDCETSLAGLMSSRKGLQGRICNLIQVCRYMDHQASCD